jgi:two-component system, chemotaxis family, CheB/CheR fusion protein
MPRHSIATGLVDDILPIAEIPAKIIAYKEGIEKVQLPLELHERIETDEHSLLEIFTLLRVRTKHDFTNYKRATVLPKLKKLIWS